MCLNNGLVVDSILDSTCSPMHYDFNDFGNDVSIRGSPGHPQEETSVLGMAAGATSKKLG